MPSASTSFASEEKEEESESVLPALLEDIPARSIGPSELVPVGRTATEKNATNSKVVRVIEPQLHDENSNVNDATSKNTTKFECFHAAAIEFLSSHTYRLISGVFGTMLVFFVIGMRIEALLIETGVMVDNESTWQ
jgi:hypothetical protein